MATTRDHQNTVVLLKNNARVQGHPTLTITSVDVNNETCTRLNQPQHHYQSANNSNQHELPKACKAMENEMLDPRDTLSGPPSKQGIITVTYYL